MLKWSAKETAERSGVALTTVQRLEQHDGPASGRAQTHFDMQRAFEAAGVEFIGTPDDKPGVRLSRSTKAEPAESTAKAAAKRPRR